MTHALTSEGADASEDGTGRGTPIVVAVHENQRGELTTALTTGGGKPGQGYPCIMQTAATLTARYAKGADSDASDASDAIIVQPLAVRGRDGGSDLEAGAPGAPYNALRAGDGGSSRQSLIAIQRHAETSVRRLTPLECERLQGFPDNWTENQSDAQRYRQMGNSLAVPVVEWIAQRLVTVDSELDDEECR